MQNWQHPEDLLGVEALRLLDALGPTEVLVTVCALNQARSAPQVVESVTKGLSGALTPRASAVLVVDAGVHGDTAEAIRGWAGTHAPVPPVRGIRVIGAPSRGRAIRTALAAARHLEVSAWVLVDAGLLGLTGEGLECLLRPLLEGEADYVLPAFSHAPSEGTLTSNLLAPLCGALYGRRPQQVVGACAGLSGECLKRVLQVEPWDEDLTEHGLEIRLVVEALTSGDRIVEAHLGRKVLDPGPAPGDLATTLAHTLGPFFRLMDRYRSAWLGPQGGTPLAEIGGPARLLPETGSVPVDRMVRAFKLGLKDLLPVWEQALPEETLGQLYPLGLLGPEEFEFPPDLWAQIVADFAVAYHESRLPRDHLLRALTPLYLGRVAAFLRDVHAVPPARVPALLDILARAFEAETESLAARWR
jgi:glucosylglycerate synthase